MITFVTKMITMFKPGYKRILELFYKDKSASLHLREIARQAGLHEPSATRFLNALEKEGLLKVTREGNLKKYGIRQTSNTYLIFEIFDMERFERLPENRRRAIRIFLNELSERPVFALLFGSCAKATFNENSDIDILIVSNRKINTAPSEREVDAQAALKVSTFQIGYNEFLKEIKLREDKVIQSAINTGYPLNNHIEYYGAINNKRI